MKLFLYPLLLVFFLVGCDDDGVEENLTTETVEQLLVEETTEQDKPVEESGSEQIIEQILEQENLSEQSATGETDLEENASVDSFFSEQNESSADATTTDTIIIPVTDKPTENSNGSASEDSISDSGDNVAGVNNDNNNTAEEVVVDQPMDSSVNNDKTMGESSALAFEKLLGHWSWEKNSDAKQYYLYISPEGAVTQYEVISDVLGEDKTCYAVDEEWVMLNVLGDGYYSYQQGDVITKIALKIEGAQLVAVDESKSSRWNVVVDFQLNTNCILENASTLKSFIIPTPVEGKPEPEEEFKPAEIKVENHLEMELEEISKPANTLIEADTSLVESLPVDLPLDVNPIKPIDTEELFDTQDVQVIEMSSTFSLAGIWRDTATYDTRYVQIKEGKLQIYYQQFDVSGKCYSRSVDDNGKLASFDAELIPNSLNGGNYTYQENGYNDSVGVKVEQKGERILVTHVNSDYLLHNLNPSKVPEDDLVLCDEIDRVYRLNGVWKDTLTDKDDARYISIHNGAVTFHYAKVCDASKATIGEQCFYRWLSEDNLNVQPLVDAKLSAAENGYYRYSEPNTDSIKVSATFLKNHLHLQHITSGEFLFKLASVDLETALHIRRTLPRPCQCNKYTHRLSRSGSELAQATPPRS